MGGRSYTSQEIINDVVNRATTNAVTKSIARSSQTISGRNEINLICDRNPTDVARMPVCLNPQSAAACKAVLDAQVAQCTIKDSEITQINTFNLDFDQQTQGEIVADIHGQIENELTNEQEKTEDMLGATLRAFVPGGSDTNVTAIRNNLVTEIQNSITTEFVTELETNVNLVNEFNVENYRLDGATVTQEQMIGLVSTQLAENEKLTSVINDIATTIDNKQTQKEEGVFNVLNNALALFSNPWFLIIVGGIIVLFLLFKFGGMGGGGGDAPAPAPAAQPAAAPQTVAAETTAMGVPAQPQGQRIWYMPWRRRSAPMPGDPYITRNALN